MTSTKNDQFCDLSSLYSQIYTIDLLFKNNRILILSPNFKPLPYSPSEWTS